MPKSAVYTLWYVPSPAWLFSNVCQCGLSSANSLQSLVWLLRSSVAECFVDSLSSSANAASAGAQSHVCSIPGAFNLPTSWNAASKTNTKTKTHTKTNTKTKKSSAEPCLLNPRCFLTMSWNACHWEEREHKMQTDQRSLSSDFFILSIVATVTDALCPLETIFFIFIRIVKTVYVRWKWRGVGSFSDPYIPCRSIFL